MDRLLRLCIHYGIELWFSPQLESWSNGVVEQFNHHYQQKFLDRITMRSIDEMKEGNLVFEKKNCINYRYSKLKDKTLLKALAQSGKKQLHYPPQQPALKIRLTKPESGQYHVIRFIRSDCRFTALANSFTSRLISSTSMWLLPSMLKSINSKSSSINSRWMNLM